MSYVYFMRPVGRLGPIKIGYSTLPDLRLAQHQVWSPDPLELLAKAPGTPTDECTLHSMFSDSWLHCEWFRASDELLMLIGHVVLTGRLPELPAGLPPFRANRPRRETPLPDPICEALKAFGRTIADEYEGGASIAELAAKYGRSPSTTRRALVGAGVKMRRGCPRGPRKHVALPFAEAA
jgi:hypothetical protein